MPRVLMPAAQVLDLLAAAPTRIAALTAGLGEGLLTTSLDGEWSANEVLAHLRSCSDVWGDSIERIVAEESPTIRAVNPTTWIESTDYTGQTFRASLRLFAAQRGDLLVLLESLAPGGWSRSATVTGAGAPLHKTVLDFADRLARHERSHVRQLCTLVTQLQV